VGAHDRLRAPAPAPHGEVGGLAALGVQLADAAVQLVLGLDDAALQRLGVLVAQPELARAVERRLRAREGHGVGEDGLRVAQVEGGEGEARRRRLGRGARVQLDEAALAVDASVAQRALHLSAEVALRAAAAEEVVARAAGEWGMQVGRRAGGRGVSGGERFGRRAKDSTTQRRAAPPRASAHVL